MVEVRDIVMPKDYRLHAEPSEQALFGAVFLDSEKDLTVTQRAIEKFLARDEEEYVLPSFTFVRILLTHLKDYTPAQC